MNFVSFGVLMKICKNQGTLSKQKKYSQQIYLLHAKLSTSKGIYLHPHFINKKLHFLFLKSDSYLPKKFCFTCFIKSALKMMKNAFYFILKALFSRYLNFCHDFMVMLKKRIDQKDKVNFKIHDVTAWLTNNCNTHIAQYLTK